MKLGKVNGIGVYLHWSVWMIILFHLISSTLSGGLSEGVFAAAFVTTVLGCVVAHEFGHAAAAARYGIKTTDISLYAFGGIARLASLPKSPAQEFVIAVAGPAVNVAIASVLAILMAIQMVPSGLVGSEVPVEGARLMFADYILWANVFLVVFNMLPAFPMDGGRVLRSLLAMRTGNLRATEIAAQVGRWMALLFAVASLFVPSFMLLIIAGFVFLAGTTELMQVRLRAAAGNPAGEPWPGSSPFQTPGGASFAWRGSFPGAGPQTRSPYPGESLGPDHSDVIDANDVRRID